ncbi:MAG: tail fiber protein, partial [Thermoplasmata archaeon]
MDETEIDPVFGLVPSGTIVMWNGTVIPNGWALCDGTNGTPDLRGM